ncbi:hypothetical protein [Paenibacillus apii]|nr:hypothetical protein [Paenibacillus apii]
MEKIYLKPGQRVEPNVNNLSPSLLLKIKMDIERNKPKGEKKSG